MKKPDIYLKEYCQRLSDENLKFLAGRLNQRLTGDIAEVLDFFSSVKEMDRWFSTANSCDELFDMIDLTHSLVAKEHERRSSKN